jgi:iron complex transport system substrate-binding protein
MVPYPDRLLWGFVQAFSRIILAAITLLAGCKEAVPKSEMSARPMRIVSLDYCADQFVLKLADRADIVALSPDATRSFSYLRDEAKGMRQVRASAEDVLALRPDLIVRSYGGGPGAEAFFERAGVKVHQIGWGDDFDAVRTNVADAAKAMGQSARGQIVIEQFDQRLASLEKSAPLTTLYLTPGGVTTGSGSMVDLMMRQAGLTNFERRAGWHPISLEQLVRAKPDLVAKAQFGADTDHQDQWSVSRHPVMQDLLAKVPVAQFDGATTSCAGWFVLDGVEAIANRGRAAMGSLQ